MNPEIERLSSIKSFPSLVKYLRDDLGWPINSEDFDDITFDLLYDPSDMGLDEKTLTKIKDLKQLRPLTSNQPWGIFFVNFEPKQLPVVVLRRILKSLVIKKRPSASKAHRPAWECHDLLFISAYGEGNRRELSFAHFAENPESKDLPTLKVLGWDDENTVLHLAHVHQTLKEKLQWPSDTGNLTEWRQSWGEAFTLRHREVITTSKALAEKMAELAGRIRKRVSAILKIESEKGPIRTLHKAFQQTLIHDLSEDDFADMYAQTITYGLFSARCSRTEGLVADNLHQMVPVTNPFLKELLETFLTVGGRKSKIDFDELGVNDVVEMLRDANIEAVKRDFDDKNPEHDPVIHFYEDFLKQYDAKRKVQRGVFYTPKPVVSYIVRSVHELLQTEFGLADGLADTTTWGQMEQKYPGLKRPMITLQDPKSGEISDVPISENEPFVKILDPATGTGTFLVEAIEVIHKTMQKKWGKEGHLPLEFGKFWNQYVPKHLLPRLYGYELMMAPYAISHMKIGLKLGATGYKFKTEERARIYLTNALEPWASQLPLIGFDALAHEAQAVNSVKQYQRFTVVIGNPPYAGHSQNNQIQSIVNLVKDFTRDEPSLQGPGQGKWLQDDYVKFLRLSQKVLDEANIGALGMITNHRYLTNRTFKGMRRQWCSIFPEIQLLDLHGNNVVHEVSPLGYDENVFDIEQGVSIGFFTRALSAKHRVTYSELWGNRTTTEGKGKYDFLSRNSARTTKWDDLKPAPPNWLFAPREEMDDDVRAEFESGLKMLELMPGALGPNGKPQSGLATMHDNFALSFSIDELEEKIRAFVRTNDREEAKELFGTLCNPGQWDYAEAKKTLSGQSWRKRISRIWFSPFDQRLTVYDNAVAVHLRKRLSQHLFNRKNLALVIGEAGQEISGEDWDAVCCVDSILQLNFFRRNGSPTLPLYIFDDNDLLSVRGGADIRRITDTHFGTYTIQVSHWVTLEDL